MRPPRISGAPLGAAAPPAGPVPHSLAGAGRHLVLFRDYCKGCGHHQDVHEPTQIATQEAVRCTARRQDGAPCSCGKVRL